MAPIYIAKSRSYLDLLEEGFKTPKRHPETATPCSINSTKTKMMKASTIARATPYGSDKLTGAPKRSKKASNANKPKHKGPTGAYRKKIMKLDKAGRGNVKLKDKMPLKGLPNLKN